MATDVVLTAQIIDAAIAQLTAHLPTNWSPAPVPEPTYTQANPDPHYAWETPLTDVVHGDYSDLAIGEGGIMSVLPIIIIRPLTLDELTDGGGVNNVSQDRHALRLVHIRAFSQCHADSGAIERNLTRARLRYARLIHRALYNDQYYHLGSPTLTTATGETATVDNVIRGRWDWAGLTPDVAEIRELGKQLWAIAHDFSVDVTVTP